MTCYKNLSRAEQKEVDEELSDDSQLLNRVKDGSNCSECFMVYYNCLCFHDDD